LKSSEYCLKFIADSDLKALVKRLRMLGINCLYDGSMALPDVIQTAAREERILLTMKPVASSQKVKVFKLLNTEVADQLRQLLKAFSLIESANPFTRCLVCNTELVEVSEPVQVPESVKERMLTICRCQECNRLYWQGSHIDRMKAELKKAGISLA